MSLSPTQARIAAMLLADLSVKAMARELDMKPRTVSMHLGRMRQKAGARTTLGLALKLDRMAR